MTIAASASGVGGMVTAPCAQVPAVSERERHRARPQEPELRPRPPRSSCAGLTSWNALYGLRAIKPGDSILVQGTGGVSLFALQFAKAAGATVIATTSSKEKAEMVKKLGADHVINYKEDENWGETAAVTTQRQRQQRGGGGMLDNLNAGPQSTTRRPDTITRSSRCGIEGFDEIRNVKVNPDPGGWAEAKGGNGG
ncbi:hypothetical protein NUW58_g8934 [Xylaria curta]|uniref:Uncharacterized protein n=1 Tax=Xylaria curta TaxID=42375 RepID=A0ACC1N3T5_9PEZI|nr:hypothetical protein NUW58_g8934 [Xylaria curta]